MFAFNILQWKILMFPLIGMLLNSGCLLDVLLLDVSCKFVGIILSVAFLPTFFKGDSSRLPNLSLIIYDKKKRAEVYLIFKNKNNLKYPEMFPPFLYTLVVCIQ